MAGKKFNQDRWMYKTMCGVIGTEAEEPGLLSDRMKFVYLYRDATEEQRIAFFEQTKLAQERPDELEKLVRGGCHRPFQVLPAERAHRHEDISYFVVPRSDR